MSRECRNFSDVIHNYCRSDKEAKSAPLSISLLDSVAQDSVFRHQPDLGKCAKNNHFAPCSFVPLRVRFFFFSLPAKRAFQFSFLMLKATGFPLPIKLARDSK